jgi:hypothetical protein
MNNFVRVLLLLFAIETVKTEYYFSAIKLNWFGATTVNEIV